jgi:CRISPR/Cas system-associated exonuclease Cas4 (RecB family)
MSNEIKLQRNDDILCSAGRGRRSKVACLACALSHNNECGYDYALLNALFSDKERTGVHVTDLTGCLRRAYYEKMEGALEHPHEMLARFVGTAVHGFIEQFPSEHLDSELPLSLDGLEGTADVVYKNGTIVDFKTTRWMKINNLPYGSHAKQVNVYAAMLRAQGREVNRAYIQYVDLSGPSKCTTCKGPLAPGSDGVMVCQRCTKINPNAHTGAHLVEIELEPEGMIAEWIETRKRILDMALEAEQTPEAEASFLCDYCAFREQCYAEDAG